ncbi:MAG: hypothetical protein H6739_02275 [Alphaproteobacteria bacterium]|nr:hypothetical protein [Alphaproteobacteria bacterium]
MSFALTDAEYQPLELLAEVDLADLAIELDMIPDEVIDRRGLLDELVPRLLDRARAEGLPFSKYDADDLEELPTEHRAALARCMGWPAEVTAMLKAGGRVYKVYRKSRRNSQIPLLLPILLKPLARWADETVS